jgi:hypothetical protein
VVEKRVPIVEEKVVTKEVTVNGEILVIIQIDHGQEWESQLVSESASQQDVTCAGVFLSFLLAEKYPSS